MRQHRCWLVGRCRLVGRTASVLIGRTAPFDMKAASIEEMALFAAVLQIDDVLLTDKVV